MKNKRQQAKQLTFDKILQVTKKLIEEVGILKLKTIDIAKNANVAHGTLFAHFETKEALPSCPFLKRSTTAARGAQLRLV